MIYSYKGQGKDRAVVRRSAGTPTPPPRTTATPTKGHNHATALQGTLREIERLAPTEECYNAYEGGGAGLDTVLLRHGCRERDGTALMKVHTSRSRPPSLANGVQTGRCSTAYSPSSA